MEGCYLCPNLTSNEKWCTAGWGLLAITLLAIGIIAMSEINKGNYQGIGSMGEDAAQGFGGVGVIILLAMTTYYFKLRETPTITPTYPSHIPAAQFKLPSHAEVLARIPASAKTVVKPNHTVLDLQEIEVVHICQIHNVKGIEKEQYGPDIIEEIFECQHEIARYIIDNEITEVFDEGAIETSQFDILEYQEHFQKLEGSQNWKEAFSGPKCFLEYVDARRLFPNGLPKTTDSYTPAQKKWFMKNPTVRTLGVLGHLKTVHSVHPDKETYKETWASIKQLETTGANSVNSNEYRSLVHDQREAFLVEELRKHVEANPEVKKIYILYGDGHKLGKYFKCKKFDRVTFYEGYKDYTDKLANRLVEKEMTALQQA